MENPSQQVLDGTSISKHDTRFESAHFLSVSVAVRDSKLASEWANYLEE